MQGNESAIYFNLTLMRRNEDLGRALNFSPLGSSNRSCYDDVHYPHVFSIRSSHLFTFQRDLGSQFYYNNVLNSSTINLNSKK
jgi:hypothetical protein